MAELDLAELDLAEFGFGRVICGRASGVTDIYASLHGYVNEKQSIIHLIKLPHYKP